MKKYSFSFNFFRKKKCILLLVILLCFLSKTNSLYFQVYQLSSKYYLWVSTGALFKYNQNFMGSGLTLYTFNDNQKINENDAEELELVRFSEYSDEFGYSILAVKQFFYFIDNQAI